MLSTIFHSKRAQFATLAEVWLAAGAKTFSIWCNDCMLAQWPVDGQPDDELVTVPIQVDETAVGTLQVTGLNGTQTYTRLAAEAAWIAQLIKFECKLDELPPAPTEWQSQLLKIIPVVTSVDDPVEIGRAFGEFISEARQAIQAESAFVALDTIGQTMIIEQCPPGILDEATFNYFFERMEADRCHEILLDRKNAASIVPPEVSGIYLSATPLHERTMMIVGFLLKQPLNWSAPNLRLAHEIGEFAGAQLTPAWSAATKPWRIS